MRDYVTLITNLSTTDSGKIVGFFIGMFILFGADFLTGVYKSYKLKVPNSSIGKEGLFKHFSILALLGAITYFCLFIGKIMMKPLYMFYLTYIFTEFQSIIENLDQAGYDVKIFKIFIQTINDSTIGNNDKTIKK